jgi:glutaredoxin 3
MNAVTLYSTGHCPFCRRAEALLAARGVTDIEHIDVGVDAALRQAMIERSGRRSVPQIYIGDRHVGGFDDLAKADREGVLQTWLQAAGVLAGDAG